MKRKHGFTLIELMIVIAIIGILVGSTFKLMEVAANSKARAVTIARMERLQNALSGYYAAYGMYPAVPFYGDPDPSSGSQKSEGTGDSMGSGTKESAQAAARAQPVGFEYPTPVWMDRGSPPYIVRLFHPDNVMSVNMAIGSLHATDGDWNKYKAFKFGLLSFLLPRVELVGHPNLGDHAPLREVYQKAQWMENNVSSRVPGASNQDIKKLLNTLEKQRQSENEACMRWLPSFKGILCSFKDTVSGIHIDGDEHGGHRLGRRQMQGGPAVALALTTIMDGWGREFFYHSAPPYQSFKVWSAGPDGLTFPPWVPSTDSTYKKLNAQNWIKDDIVGGKIQM